MAKTQITAEPGVPWVDLTREFEASRDLVFRAHTDPELLVQWLGPRQYTMIVDQYNVRHGGTWRYVHRDEAGNEGRSEPFEMRLPERPFSKPMARALIEQRRMLALDGDAQANVLTALDALTLAPERFAKTLRTDRPHGPLPALVTVADDADQARFGGSAGPFYRIVVRVRGARNTTSFTETIVHF